jgi:DNA-binding transcriptional ArsR family regulator
MSRPMSNESVFRAIADPTRRRVIDLLRRRELSPSELAEQMRIKNEALSFHLRVLLQAGVASQRRRGRKRFYRLHPRTFATVIDWVSAIDPRASSREN